MHGRHRPKRNFFTYGIYYLSLPLSQLDKLPIRLNRSGIISFFTKDHGYKDPKKSLSDWAKHILNHYDITTANGEIVLVCLPRIMGYVFNPVSFWFCYDQQEKLRAVICEVNNTFGETHSYLCAHEDQRPITASDTMVAEKNFHVSPFMQREGYYEFRFDNQDTKFTVSIDYFTPSGEKLLVTTLFGRRADLTSKNLWAAFWRYPLITFKAIALIHWQALKLISRGIKYVPKPNQKPEKHSRNDI